jgi:quinol-cytochrome oxidoreductase complex cytochrome b subunit/coenzyme F420-reducing hydrogenase delta subunit
MLGAIQNLVQLLVAGLRRVLDAAFVPNQFNPLRHLGALTIFFFWIVLVSGIWLFIFFRTSVDGAYESVEYLTHDQWFLGGVMRSLHRYASDAAVVTLVLHIVREFSFDRYRGKRWFSWVTGVPLLWMVIPLGITGYWLVWDELAQYVALSSAELLDALPIFTDYMARNFLSDQALSNRFFTLMAFLHLIGLPLFLVFGIWLHVLRINGPEVNPPRLLMAGSLLAMLLLSLVFPALSQGKANLASVPGALAMDWFYLLIYPLIDSWSLSWVWALLVGISLLVFVAPWLPPQRAKKIAVVNLDFCNGCERCVEDCPFSALTMEPRSDGKSFEAEAVVDPDLCISCGICVGSCPTATPFRTRGDLTPGIDLPDHSMARLRATIQDHAAGLEGERRVIVFCCESAGKLQRHKDKQTTVISLVCMGQLPPSFIDYVLSRDLADGVLMAGCGSEACQYRFGADWTAQRLNRVRDPHLRARVPDQRLAMAWEQPWSGRSLTDVLSRFRNSLSTEPTAKAEVKSRLAITGLFSKQALAYAAFVALVGLFSVWPRYRMIGEEQAIVSLTFTHAGQRLEACRKLSQKEMQELPPNMRKPEECPRERHPVEVTFTVDGEPGYQASRPPSGIWSDGESSVYQRIEMEAGEHSLFIAMRDSGRKEGFDFQLQQKVDIAPGQHIVVEFNQSQQQFVIR